MANPPDGLYAGIAIGVSSVSAALSVSTALFGDWFKERFGFKGMATLSLGLESGSPFSSHAWFRNVPALVGENRQDGLIDGSLGVQVLRLLVCNSSHNAARNVSVWLTGLWDLKQTHEKTERNIIALRWSDTWRFTTDKAEKTLLPSDVDMTFPLIPSCTQKFCDLCVYYGPSGPGKVDRFERGRVYFAVYNMPSKTFSVGPGSHDIELQVVAENARPCRLLAQLNFNPTAAALEDRLTITNVREHTAQDLKAVRESMRGSRARIPGGGNGTSRPRTGG